MHGPHKKHCFSAFSSLKEVRLFEVYFSAQQNLKLELFQAFWLFPRVSNILIWNLGPHLTSILKKQYIKVPISQILVSSCGDKKLSGRFYKDRFHIEDHESSLFKHFHSNSGLFHSKFMRKNTEATWQKKDANYSFTFFCKDKKYRWAFLRKNLEGFLIQSETGVPKLCPTLETIALAHRFSAYLELVRSVFIETSLSGEENWQKSFFALFVRQFQVLNYKCCCKMNPKFAYFHWKTVEKNCSKSSCRRKL